MISSDFQFADNAAVNDFAAGRAELIFGRDWKDRCDQLIAQSSLCCICISVVNGEKAGWSLTVETKDITTSHYKVSCKKNGSFEDPSPCSPAIFHFNSQGQPVYASHCSEGIGINPPGGTPSVVYYNDDGIAAECLYMRVRDGKNVRIPATKAEVTSRIAAANRVAITALCDGEQDIVALSDGLPQPLAAADSFKSHPLAR